jgi:hypothetical protein
LAVVGGLARLGAGAGTVGAAVVGGEGAAVVVPEFDDDDVVGLDGVDDGLEAAFDCEGAGGAAAEGLVAYGEGEGVGEVVAPAWKVFSKEGLGDGGELGRYTLDVPGFVVLHR